MSSPQISSIHFTSRRKRAWHATTSLALAGLVALGVSVPASAASISGTWQARIGSAGINGSAKIQAFDTGSGTIAIKLNRLRPSTSLAVVISRGSCATVGGTVISLPQIRTASNGTASRTSNLTSTQMKSIVAATKVAGRIAIRIGTGTARKCGVFAYTAPAVVVPTVAATIPVGEYPQQVALDATGVWVTNAYDRSLTRIDPKTNTVLSVVPVVLPGVTVPTGIASGFGSMWVSFLAYDDSGTNLQAGSVVRVDPASGAVLGTPIPVGRGDDFVATSPEAIWVSNYADGSVSRIDPLTNQVTATIPVGGSPFGMAAGFGSLWVANEADGKVARIDPATNQAVASIQTRENAESVAVGAGSIWVSFVGPEGQPGGTVSRIDPTTNTVVAAVSVGIEPILLAFGGGNLWVGMTGEPTVVEVDAQTNTVKKRIDVGATSWGIAASDHTVWVVHPVALGNDPKAALPGTVTKIVF